LAADYLEAFVKARAGPATVEDVSLDLALAEHAQRAGRHAVAEAALRAPARFGLAARREPARVDASTRVGGGTLAPARVEGDN